MAVLGGFRTFSGPIVGALVFNYLEVFAVSMTVYWQLVLGVILVALVLAMPTGLVGTAAQLVARARGRRP
jgi:branched-chain amino acid transport system permease protein